VFHVANTLIKAINTLTKAFDGGKNTLAIIELRYVQVGLKKSIISHDVMWLRDVIARGGREVVRCSYCCVVMLWVANAGRSGMGDHASEGPSRLPGGPSLRPLVLRDRRLCHPERPPGTGIASTIKPAPGSLLGLD
jgi:hypothetical protein